MPKKHLNRVLKKARSNVLVRGAKHLLDKTEVDDYLFAKASRVQREIRKHIITAISAALAFIIALFWRDAIQTGITEILQKFDVSTDTYIYKMMAAVIVTILCVVGIMLIARMEHED